VAFVALGRVFLDYFTIFLPIIILPVLQMNLSSSGAVILGPFEATLLRDSLSPSLLSVLRYLQVIILFKFYIESQLGMIEQYKRITNFKEALADCSVVTLV